ncbi:MAG: plastocyanin/azurin family copper-binding protein [archaeon]
MNGIPLLFIAALLLFSGCTSPNESTPIPPAPNGNGNGATIIEVQLKNIAFNPGTLTVNQGDTIRFTNMDGFAHDIFIHTEGNEFFTDSQTEPGEIVEVTMTQKGTFTLDCVRHAPGMTGTIIVN